MRIPSPPALIFTDLDGTLLDHETYSFSPALPLLKSLERAAVPVLPVTSKTFSELVVLREELGNKHPFIAENGAAVFLPKGYFPEQPPETKERDGFWVHEFGNTRAHFLALLESLAKEFPGEFETFAGLGGEGIARITGLDKQQASLANQRDYSEPVHWLGSEAQKAHFIQRLANAGAAITEGGRFLSVSNQSNKGTALKWLRQTYQDAWQTRDIHDLAAGDSPNDTAMLNQAGTALLVRSPHRSYPALTREPSNIIYADRPGPEGWVLGVKQWLGRIGLHTAQERIDG